MASGKILVAQGGGPTAVINQSLVGVALEARRFGNIERIYGARHGVRGIINEDLVDLTQETHHNLELVASTPASALGSTRDKPDLKYCQEIFAVLRAQDNLASTKAEENAFKRQLDQANERFDVGLSDKTDVLEAQAGYDTSVANRIIAQQQVDDAFQALTTLTNRDYSSVDGMRHSLPILPPTPSDAKALAIASPCGSRTSGFRRTKTEALRDFFTRPLLA